MTTPQTDPQIERVAPYHGLHIAPMQRQHERLRWTEPGRRTQRIRVKLHTCDCKATIYEFCQAGGLLFIRRTVRGPDGPVIHESDRWISARAEQIWLLLVTGQAR